MTTKKITLNAEKRKVIADQFQSFYEDKVKDKLVQAKEQYDLMREKAKEKIANMDRNSEYSSLITKLLTEATSALNTSDVIVYTNSKDKDVVQSAVSNISGAELSNDPIDCMGGVKVTSKDGSMSFDNTIDARIELLKPLIRKDIAAQFNLGN